jgi:hypothetical protein
MGGYFKGDTGVYAQSVNGHAVAARGITANKAAIYGESLGIDGNSVVDGYGVYATTKSTTKAAIYGLNNDISGGFAGGQFVGKIGVYGQSTGTDQYSEGVAGTTTGLNAPGVYGLNNGSSHGYGIWGEATNGVGVYGKGKTYAGQFDGTVMADQFLPTDRPVSMLQTNAISSLGTRVADVFPFFKNMVFDGSEIWLVHNDTNSGQNDFIYRYDPQTFGQNRKITYTGDTMGQMSKLVAVPPNANGGGVYYWDGTGKVYSFEKTDLNPALVSGASTISSGTVTTAIYFGGLINGLNPGGFVVGTTTGTGTGNLYYTPYNFTSYTAVTGAGTIGSIVDFALDNDQLVYALSDLSGTADQIFKLNAAGKAVLTTYTLPYTTTLTQTAKDMVFDGRYLWVLLDGSGAADIIARVDINDNTAITEYYLTNDGTSTGTSQCTGPTGLEYDGVYLWIACNTVASGTGGMILFSPTTKQLVQYLKGNSIYYIDFGSSHKPLGAPLFDGTNVFVVTKQSSTSYLRKYYSGHGNGYNAPWISNGVNLIGTDGSGNPAQYCLKILTGAVVAAPGLCSTTTAFGN